MSRVPDKYSNMRWLIADEQMQNHPYSGGNDDTNIDHTNDKLIGGKVSINRSFFLTWPIGPQLKDVFDYFYATALEKRTEVQIVTSNFDDLLQILMGMEKSRESTLVERREIAKILQDIINKDFQVKPFKSDASLQTRDSLPVIVSKTIGAINVELQIANNFKIKTNFIDFYPLTSYDASKGPISISHIAFNASGYSLFKSRIKEILKCYNRIIKMTCIY